jgi:hypothetical protein
VGQLVVPTVSWTSACLRPEVANVREALLHRLPVCRAERVNVCRSIVSSRLARKKGKKRCCTKRAAVSSISYVLEALALVFSGQPLSAEKASSLIGRDLPTAKLQELPSQSKLTFLLHSFWAHFIVGKLEFDSASAGSSLQSSLPLSCALEHEKGAVMDAHESLCPACLMNIVSYRRLLHPLRIVVKTKLRLYCEPT